MFWPYGMVESFHCSIPDVQLLSAITVKQPSAEVTDPLMYDPYFEQISDLLVWRSTLRQEVKTLFGSTTAARNKMQYNCILENTHEIRRKIRLY